MIALTTATVALTVGLVSAVSIALVLFCAKANRNSIQLDQIPNIRETRVEAATEPVNELPSTSFDVAFAPRERLVTSALQSPNSAFDSGDAIQIPTSNVSALPTNTRNLPEPKSRMATGKRKAMRQKERRARAKIGSFSGFTRSRKASSRKNSTEQESGRFSVYSIFTLTRRSKKLLERSDVNLNRAKLSTLPPTEKEVDELV